MPKILTRLHPGRCGRRARGGAILLVVSVAVTLARRGGQAR